MPIQVQAQIIGVSNVRRVLRETNRKGGDLRPAYREFDRSVSRYFRLRFASGGRFGGGSWAGLAPATIRHRLSARGGNRGGITRPLWDFGNLRASLVAPGPQSVRVIQPLKYERGSSVPYLTYHMTGTEHMPARPVIPQRMPIFLTRALDNALDQHFADLEE